MTLRISLTGDLRVETDGAQVEGAAFPGRQGRLVFAYLACRRRPAERDVLADLLWPDELPREWERHVSAVISRLRALLAPLWPEPLVVRRGAAGYELCLPDDAAVDVEEAAAARSDAEAALRRADLDAALTAASVVTGIARRPFLPGETGRWVEEKREELRRILHDGLRLLGEATASKGRLTEAVGLAREAVDLDPYDEDGWVRLLRLEGAAGDRSAAVRTYERCRDTLVGELGLELPPDVEVAYREATSGRRQAASASLPPWLEASQPLPLVGRDAELERLADHLDGVGPPVLAVVGEPGIGKTRVVAAAVARAHERGLAVVAGRCVQYGGRPYQAFAGIADLDQLRAAGAHSDDPDVDRARFLDALAAAVQPDPPGPVVVVLDDLQWADSGSFLVLVSLARSARPGLRILATYRDTDASPDGPLTVAMAALHREQLLDRVRLTGLDRDAVATLTTAALPALGAASLDDLAGQLTARTDGNPFFLHELLNHLGAEAEPPPPGTRWKERLAVLGVPEGVQDMVALRLVTLPSEAAGALAAAAITGAEFDLAVVAEVAGLSEEAAAEALDAAERAGLLVEGDRPARFRFAHALIRDAIDARLGAGRRAMLHRRAAAALETAGAADDVALAHHLSRAGGRDDAARAVEYAIRAGDHALSLLAYEEAAAQYELAATCAEGSTPEARCRIFLAVGDAHIRAGHAAPARRSLLDAAELARAAGSAELLAEAALRLGAVLVDEGLEGGLVDGVLVAHLREALSVVEHGRTELRARLLARLGQELHFGGEHETRGRLTSEALQLARSSGDPEAMRAALVARHYDLLGSPDVDERVSVAEELSALQGVRGDPGVAALWLARDQLELGDLEEADRSMALVAEHAAATRVPSREWVPALWQATRAVLTGDLDEAEALAGEALEIGGRGRGPTAVLAVYGAQVFAIRLLQGRVGELVTGLEEAARTSPQRPIWRAALGCALAESGRLDEAAKVLDGLAAGDFAVVHHDVDRPATLALLAWTCGPLGDAARGAVIQDLLTPYAGRTIVVGVTPAVCAGAASDAAAVAAATAGDVDRAERWFADAIDLDERLGATAWAERARDHREQYLGRGPVRAELRARG